MKSATTHWSGKWEQSTFSKGAGVIGKGKVSRLRFQTILGGEDVIRYIAVVLTVTHVHKRTFNSYKEEIIPKFNAKDLKSPHKLTMSQLFSTIGEGDLPLPKLLFQKDLHSDLHPKADKVFEFWGEMKLVKHLNLVVGEEVIFKTKGLLAFVFVSLP